MPSLMRLATVLTDTLLESVGGASISSGAEAAEEHDTLSMHGQRGPTPAVELAEVVGGHVVHTHLDSAVGGATEEGLAALPGLSCS